MLQSACGLDWDQLMKLSNVKISSRIVRSSVMKFRILSHFDRHNEVD